MDWTVAQGHLVLQVQKSVSPREMEREWGWRGQKVGEKGGGSQLEGKILE